MINVLTVFSGYDSQCLALNRLGVEYDLVAWCEIDKYAIKAHDALFPQWSGRNLGDISQVDWSAIKEPIDLLTYSSPCQDFSSAGLQRGGDEGSGTRSGLLWEVEKAIKALRPKYLVFENVSALVSDKFIGVFNKWQARLNEYGYTNFSQLMNSKDYGVPQNRVRIFMVSIRDCDLQYHFPKPFKLEKRLKDVLEQNVDERYYLKDEQVQKLTTNIDGLEVGQHLLNGDSDGNASTITTGHDRALNIIPMSDRQQFVKEPTVMQIGNLKDDSNSNFKNPQTGRVYSADGLSPTINTCQGGQREPKIVEPTIIEDFNGTVRDPRVYTEEAPTLRADRTGLMATEGIRIRHLTERELYRLMDVEEKDIDTLLNAGIPKTQHAKLAGNSIVVACLYYIFDRLLVNTEAQANEQISIF